MSLLLALLLGCGCNGQEDVVPPTSPATASTPVPFQPAAVTMYRLTDPEWRNSVEDLLGIRFEGPLPVDYVLHGYARIGGSELTIPPLDLELYEAAAWKVAEDLVTDAASREALLGCDGIDAACARGFATRFAHRAWRRPADLDEVDELEDLYGALLADTDADVATRAVVAAVLLSPSFLFRVEAGEPDPDHPEWRRYTSPEMAGRLASFLTASVPDEALLEAGERGDLLDPAELEAHARRLLDGPRAAEALTDFFSETLELQDLDTVTKDEALYPEFTPALRTEMRLELELMFRDVALERDADLGELLTTDRAFVGPALGGLYGVNAGGGVTEVDLPQDQDRGGILGRAGLMTLQAHNVLTSPTYRGKFVQTRILCRSIPPPPPGVVLDLDALGTEGTLRDRLSQHASDPVCDSCHSKMDPIGYALEHYDPIGRRRDLDNGLPIDATGDLDGVAFDGARELGEVVAAHPDFAGCVALQLYRSASGQAEQLPELVAVDELSEAFAGDGRRFRELVVRLVTSDAFRLAVGPIGEPCATDDGSGTSEEGQLRDCGTGCGAGVEICHDGRWRACTATAPSPETCDGADQDCDGLVDERLVRACDAEFGPGTQSCATGEWLDCEGPVAGAEVCNGADDDGDGETDEGLEVAITAATYADIAAAHYACDPWSDAYSPACHAAAHRGCAAVGCAVTGWGPLELRGLDADFACLDASEGFPQAATFTELSTFHGGCNAGSRQGGDCNAAISRLCNARGQNTGFGPVENSGDDATIVCTPGATVLDASYAVLGGFDPGCNAYGERAGAACSRAIDRWCRDEGFETGHGPLENSGDLAVVACMGVP